MSRFITFVLATGLLATTLVAANSMAANAASPVRLRVATYNIQHGVGTDGLNLEKTAQVLEATGAEVIALQEVDNHHSERSDFVDQAAWLAKRLRMRSYVYGANIDRPRPDGEPNQQYGTAILSRHKVHDWKNTFLPSGDREQRGLLEVGIEIGDVPVRFYNTHLENIVPELRMEQVTAIREIMATRSGRTILVGDINARPETVEAMALKEDLVDAWDVKGEGVGHTYKVTNPYQRIDYVLVEPSIRVKSVQLINTDASDHFPVVADLIIPG